MREGVMKSVVIKRSILINGRKTSVSLENEFWDGLREIADRGMIAHSTLVEQIDQERDNVNLSSAIRVFVFNHFRSQGRVRPAGNFEASRGKSMELRAQADGLRFPPLETWVGGRPTVGRTTTTSASAPSWSSSCLVDLGCLLTS